MGHNRRYVEITLLCLMFIASLLVEVRLPVVGVSANNLAVPLCAGVLWWLERSSTAAALRRHRLLLLTLSAFYVWVWIAAVAGEAVALSLRYAAKCSTYVFVFVALLVALNRRGNVRPAQVTAFTMIVLLAVFGLVEYAWPQSAVLTTFRNSPSVGPRVSSLLLWPNQLGVLLAIGLGLGIALVQARALARPVVFGTVPLTIATLFLSGSRNGWLVCGVLVATLMARRALALEAAAVIGALAAVVLLALPASVMQANLERLAEVGSPDRALASRTILWRDAVREIASNPVAGIGPEVFANVIGPGIERRRGINTHNLFLNVAADTGLVGLFLFLLLLWQLVRSGSPTDLSTSLPLLGIVAGQLFDCFNYDYTFMTFSVFFAAAYANSKAA